VATGANVEAAQSLAAYILNRAMLPERLIAISESLPSDSETPPLTQALAAMSELISITDQLQTLERFCESNPNSPWTPSIRANLAKCHRDRGRFSLSLAHLEAAWRAVRGVQTEGAKKVGDTVLAHWVDLLVGLGKRERLEELFS